MRNLKRALSLTLASVMLLGMMVFGTSAASYSDADDISNVTAATVLQELGIMQGSDGKFSPKTTVTRGQMAIIICKMLYGEKLSVNQFSGSQQFDDVPANAYYTGYVNLAANLGIISGYGNGKFGPGSPVTTAQAALMLTRALGYYQNGELEGKDWSENALTAITLATRLGIFNDLSLAINDPLSRDNVSAMTFNTLTRATPVKFNNILREYYTVGGGVTDGVDYIDAYEFGTSNPTLGYTNYGLYISNRSSDAMGRPGNEWATEKNGVIGTFNDTPVATWTASVSQATIYNTLGSSVVGALDDDLVTSEGSFKKAPGSATKPVMIVYQNGSTTIVDKDGNSIGTGASNGNVVEFAERNDNTAVGISGKGVVTELYKDQYGNVSVVQYGTYLMKATGSYNSKSHSLNVAMLTRASTTNVTMLDDETLDLAQFSAGDYILYTWSAKDRKVASVAKAELASGEVSTYSNTSSGYVYLDGKKYEYGKTAHSGADNGYALPYGIGDTAKVVLDKYGYILYVDDSSMSAGNYVYVDDFGFGSRLGSSIIANAYFADGTKQEITVDKVRDSSRTNITSTVEANIKSDLAGSTAGNYNLNGDGVINTHNGWYSYSKASDGKYTLTAATTNAVVSYTNNGTYSVADGTKVVRNANVNFLASAGTGNVKTSASSNEIQVAGNTGILANNNTVFVVKDPNGDLKAYNGVKAVPDIKTANTPSVGVTVTYIKTSDAAGSAYASLVYINATQASTVIDDPTTAYDTLFLLNKCSPFTRVDASNETIQMWNAIVNGEKKVIETKAGSTIATANTEFSMWYKVKEDAKGYLDATAFVNDPSSTRRSEDMGTGNVSYSGGTLSLAGTGFVAPETLKIYLVINDNTMTMDQTPDAPYEYLVTDPSGLGSLLEQYGGTGAYYAILTSSTSNILSGLYVYVDGNPIVLSSGTTGAQIKTKPDGVYTPGDKNFDSAGNGSDVTGQAADNVIFKFTTRTANQATVLTIADASGNTVYTESYSSFAVGGHFFYVYKWCDGNASNFNGWSVAARNGLTASNVGVKGTNGLTPGATYSYTITEAGTTIASGHFVA